MSQTRPRHGGQVLVDQLVLNGVERVFVVPGESYLAALDGLHDSGVDVVNARHEGGAAMMAEADGKLTGRPGIAFVTRAPGATNAAAGVHVAFQDSTPMILFIGQVASDQRDREAFQEVDYRAMFAPLAKAVYELERTDRIAEYVSRAFHVATSGRPGPVIISLPEDRLSATVTVGDSLPVRPASHGASEEAVSQLVALLDDAERPVVVVGGGGWSAEAAQALAAVARLRCWPVGASFRCQDFMDNQDEHYIGHVGIGPDPRLAARVRDADVILALGCRLGEMTTSGYTLLESPEPRQTLVHVHADANELGRVFRPSLGIAARASEVIASIAALPPPDAIPAARKAWFSEARADYLRWSEPPKLDTPLPMESVIAHLNTVLGDDAILCNGAGNYAAWLHRFYSFRRWRTQLSPTSGSMGYGLPAAIAASLRYPERHVICLAGDGCFQMSMQEFALAAERGCRLIVLVCDNQGYGTIRMHQQRHYPERAVGTSLVNPDFAAVASAYGALGLSVSSIDQFVQAFDAALNTQGPALLHLKTDPSVLVPVRLP
jgi:acetolactate synthase-1/2/3 large subunit